MIIGNGQLAKKFSNSKFYNACIFASGVSNSNCIDLNEFSREKKLLLETLKKNKKTKFVYFSSCALSSYNYLLNDYYKHKQDMENIIKQYTNNYYIFRIPQLFGELKEHSTIINFLYNCIKDEKEFIVYDEAYRYVIEICDVKKIVELYLNYSKPNIIVDIANPYSYKVLDIVKMIETLLNKKGNYKIINKRDFYTLDFNSLENFLSSYNINLKFGEKYLFNHLEQKIKEIN